MIGRILRWPSSFPIPDIYTSHILLSTWMWAEPINIMEQSLLDWVMLLYKGEKNLKIKLSTQVS